MVFSRQSNLSYLSWVFASPDSIHLNSHDSPGLNSQEADPPPPLQVAMAGKNHLNEEITPLLPTGIGERYCQTISIYDMQRSYADMNSPYK
jgi:hypothetical protein